MGAEEIQNAELVLGQPDAAGLLILKDGGYEWPRFERAGEGFLKDGDPLVTNGGLSLIFVAPMSEGAVHPKLGLL